MPYQRTVLMHHPCIYEDTVKNLPEPQEPETPFEFESWGYVDWTNETQAIKINYTDTGHAIVELNDNEMTILGLKEGLD